MTNDEWFDALTQELLAQSPFRRSEYFKRFASGALTKEQVWGHIGQWYFLIAWFPRIFSGIHSRCVRPAADRPRDAGHHRLLPRPGPRGAVVRVAVRDGALGRGSRRDRAHRGAGARAALRRAAGVGR